MKRAILVAPLLFLMSLTVFAQQSKSAATLSEKQWDDLFTALENEDWGKAAEYSSKYMRELKDEDREKSLARLRYMFIFASAGKVIEGKMSYEELEKSLKAFVGQEIMMPHSRIAVDCKGQLNTLCFYSDGNFDLSTASTNRSGTNIHAIEWIKLRENLITRAMQVSLELRVARSTRFSLIRINPDFGL